MNTQSFVQNGLIVYTDLDSTILDHDDYSFDQTLPALEQLKARQVPVIPVTSKTLVEVLSIVKKMKLAHPVIAENGSIIAFPKNYFPEQSDYLTEGGYHYQALASSYDDIVKALQQLRTEFGFKFVGFFDMSVDEVVHHTGLTRMDAIKAKQRIGSEPILWLDDETKRLLLTEKLAQKNLTLTKGGRFWHVMGEASKGQAIQIMNGLFVDNGYLSIKTIGLGDSPNDISMLEVVDVPVIMQSIRGEYMQCNFSDKCEKSAYPGPKGWNQWMLEFLKKDLMNQKGNGHG